MFKTITVTEEAYEKVRVLKRKDESFSELLTELAEKSSLEKFFGSISSEDAEEMRKSCKADRKSVSGYYGGRKWK